MNDRVVASTDTLKLASRGPGGVHAGPEGVRHDRRRFTFASIPLLLPATILLVVLFLLPVFYSFYLGGTNLRLVGPTALNPQFTGWANMERLLEDGVFWKSLGLTGVFVLGSGVLLTTGVALVLAVAMQSALKPVSSAVSIVVMIAYMLPPVTIALVWLASSLPGGSITALFGNPDADFLNTAPMMMVSAANAWSLTGLAMLMFSSALRNIPNDITEAAILENANWGQRFFRITLPLLRPTIVTTVMMMSLLSLANFTVVYLMTGGGPGSDTMILPVYSYQQAFLFSDLAYGALIGNVTVVIATVFSAIFVRLSRQRKARKTA